MYTETLIFILHLLAEVQVCMNKETYSHELIGFTNETLNVVKEQKELTLNESEKNVNTNSSKLSDKNFTILLQHSNASEKELHLTLISLVNLNLTKLDNASESLSKNNSKPFLVKDLNQSSNIGLDNKNLQPVETFKTKGQYFRVKRPPPSDIFSFYGKKNIREAGDTKTTHSTENYLLSTLTHIRYHRKTVKRIDKAVERLNENNLESNETALFGNSLRNFSLFSSENIEELLSSKKDDMEVEKKRVFVFRPLGLGKRTKTIIIKANKNNNNIDNNNDNINNNNNNFNNNNNNCNNNKNNFNNNNNNCNNNNNNCNNDNNNCNNNNNNINSDRVNNKILSRSQYNDLIQHLLKLVESKDELTCKVCNGRTSNKILSISQYDDLKKHLLNLVDNREELDWKIENDERTNKILSPSQYNDLIQYLSKLVKRKEEPTRKESKEVKHVMKTFKPAYENVVEPSLANVENKQDLGWKTSNNEAISQAISQYKVEEPVLYKEVLLQPQYSDLFSPISRLLANNAVPCCKSCNELNTKSYQPSYQYLMQPSVSNKERQVLVSCNNQPLQQAVNKENKALPYVPLYSFAAPSFNQYYDYNMPQMYPFNYL